jgi:hypothetical protein
VSRNKLDKKILVDDFFPDKVVVDFDVLGTGMIDGVGGESYSANVVTLDGWWDRKREAEVLEEHAEPVNFSGDSGEGAILGLGVGASDDGLFLGAPRNKTRCEEDTKASGRAAIVRIAVPIGVAICFKGKGTFAEE